MGGRRVVHTTGFCDATDVWVKALHDGSLALVLWNRGVCGNPRAVTVKWGDIGLASSSKMKVRDLYEHKDVGIFSESYTQYINPAGAVAALRLTPQQGQGLR